MDLFAGKLKKAFANLEQMLSNGDPHNEITLTAFRLVTMDLLELFKVMNEGTINVLGKCARCVDERLPHLYQSTTSRCRNLTQNEHSKSIRDLATRPTM